MHDQPSVYISIVLYNGTRSVIHALEALFAQQNFLIGKNLHLHILDNGSSNSLIDQLIERFGAQIEVERSPINLGFCAGHNRVVYKFLRSPAHFFLVLNPDVSLESDALTRMVEECQSDPQVGLVTPLLYRADSELRPLKPAVIDAAGMIVTPALRHLDRASGCADSSDLQRRANVFGGTGACLLLTRKAIESLLLGDCGQQESLLSVYPQLSAGAAERAPLFDEAFFAYREDADLAWRSQILGLTCRYTPHARGAHERVVLPERRKSLDPELNRLSVRNRFLLQMNNLSGKIPLNIIFWGVIIRNLLVLVGVYCTEHTSISAFSDLRKLYRRASARRAELLKRSGADSSQVLRWFRFGEYVERCDIRERV